MKSDLEELSEFCIAHHFWASLFEKKMASPGFLALSCSDCHKEGDGVEMAAFGRDGERGEQEHALLKKEKDFENFI